MSTPIWQWGAGETAKAIAAGVVSAKAVVEATLERMHAANPALNAVVVDLSDSAREAAAVADRALAAGRSLGPLHGVPVTVKINIDLQGQANSNGVPAFANTIAPGDAPVVANLKKAGAVIIGMTNTPEFSMRAFTDNPLYGLTKNPWDPAINCGGSSGGAGAAVAAGIGTIGHGNDIGGSLRGPAFCNGIATIKPTQGRIPAFNPSAVAERGLMAQFMSSQGPLARSIADVELALEVMSQRDMRDPWWVPAPLKGEAPPSPTKVAMARIPSNMRVHSEILAAYQQAAQALTDAGYAVEEVELPDLDGTWQLWCDLIMTELAVLQEDQMRSLGSADFCKTLDGFLAMATILDRDGYMKGIAQRSRVLRAWLAMLEDYPVMLTPIVTQPTPLVNADLGGNEAVKDLFWNDMRYMSAINLLGLPAAIVPVGFAGGHPAGVQLISTRYREDLCLQAAKAVEAKAGRLVKQLWAREAA